MPICVVRLRRETTREREEARGMWNEREKGMDEHEGGETKSEKEKEGKRKIERDEVRERDREERERERTRVDSSLNLTMSLPLYTSELNMFITM